MKSPSIVALGPEARPSLIVGQPTTQASSLFMHMEQGVSMDQLVSAEAFGICCEGFDS